MQLIAIHHLTALLLIKESCIPKNI